MDQQSTMQTECIIKTCWEGFRFIYCVVLWISFDLVLTTT